MSVINNCTILYNNARYCFIRHLCGATTSLNYEVPYLGGRTALDVIILILIFIGFISISTDEESSGEAANIAGSILVLLALRTNILTFLIGVSWERSLYYHKFFSVILVVTTIMHII